MKIAVVGMGYVGIPEALLFTDIKWVDKVYGIQRKSETSGYKIDLLNSGKLPFYEPGLQGYLSDAIASDKFLCTDDYSVISKCSIVVVTVQTDNLIHLEDAIDKIGLNISRRNNPLIIIVSTIPPGTTWYLKTKLETFTNREARVVHAPERVMPRHAAENIHKYPRIIGGYDKKSITLTKNLYNAIDTPSFIEMTPIEAEITKTAENGIRAIQIATANELAMICEHHGSNFYNVKRGIDSLTGEGITRALLYPGAGVGGHCLPKDGKLLIDGYRGGGIFTDAIIVNKRMPQHLWKLTREAIVESGKKLKETKIVIMGWSYLPNTSDTRNSPAIKFKELAEYNGCNVVVFDPVCGIVPEFEDLMSAETFVVITAHDVVKQQIAALLHTTPKIIIDGRNIVDANAFIKKGWIYRGIGRGDVNV